MPKEIERKFLIRSDDFKSDFLSKKNIKQGFLSLEKERIVRVRISEDKAQLTIKGENIGPVRREYEYNIPVSDANELLKYLCVNGIIEKYRYELDYKGMIWYVDEFIGNNKGLVIAEIEFEETDQFFEKPPWIGKEVTGEVKYYNAMLIKNPYSNWQD